MEVTSLEQLFNKSIQWLKVSGVSNPGNSIMVTWTKEELDEFLDARDREDQKDAIVDALVFLANIMHWNNISVEDLVEKGDEVVKSNWSKFCKSESEAWETVNAYQSGTHPDKVGESIETYYEQSGGNWVVKRKDTNKIMKSTNYKEPCYFQQHEY